MYIVFVFYFFCQDSREKYYFLCNSYCICSFSPLLLNNVLAITNWACVMSNNCRSTRIAARMTEFTFIISICTATRISDASRQKGCNLVYNAAAVCDSFDGRNVFKWSYNSNTKGNNELNLKATVA